MPQEQRLVFGPAEEPIEAVNFGNPRHVEIMRRFISGDVSAQEAGPAFSGLLSSSRIEITEESFEALSNGSDNKNLKPQEY